MLNRSWIAASSLLAFAAVGFSQAPNAPAPAPGTPAPTQEPAPAPKISGPRYATAVKGDLLGLPDSKSSKLRALTPGEPLIVTGEQGDVLEVEVPSGFTAWVYASYLRDGKEVGTVETIEDQINLRPAPKSDASTVPIARARKGQVFLVAAREGDWVSVVVPKEIKAYAMRGDVSITNDPPSAHAAEIAAASKKLDDIRASALAKENERRAAESTRKAEDAARHEGEVKEQQALKLAHQGNEMLRGTADASAREHAKGLFAEASAMSAGPSVAAEVKRGSDRIDALEFLDREMKDQNARRTAEIEDERRLADERTQRRAAALDRMRDPQSIDPFGARFAGLGWLDRGLELSRGKTFTIKQGGKLLYYVMCPSNRYDLNDYIGRELGLLGTVKTVEGYPARVIEIDRIEILSE